MKQIINAPLTTIAGTTTSLALNSFDIPATGVPEIDNSLPVIKAVISVVAFLWGIFSKKG